MLIYLVYDLCPINKKADKGGAFVCFVPSCTLCTQKEEQRFEQSNM